MPNISAILGRMTKRFANNLARDIRNSISYSMPISLSRAVDYVSDMFGAESDGSSNQSDDGIHAAIDRGIDRVSSITITQSNPYIYTNLNPVSIDPYNIVSAIEDLDTNISIVDRKVRLLDQEMQQAMYSTQRIARAVDNLQDQLDAVRRETSKKRFEDIENKMETSSINDIIRRRVDAEVANKLSQFEQTATPSIVDAIISGIAGLAGGIVGGAGGAAAVGATISGGGAALGSAIAAFGKTVGKGALRIGGPIGVGMVFTDTLFGQGLGRNDEMPVDPEGIRKFLENEHVPGVTDGSTGNDDLWFDRKDEHESDFVNLMGELDSSRIDQSSRNYFGDYDFYDLVAKVFFLKSENMTFETRDRLSIDSIGIVKISSDQRIILSAPIVEIIGKIVNRDYDEFLAGSKTDNSTDQKNERSPQEGPARAGSGARRGINVGGKDESGTPQVGEGTGQNVLDAFNFLKSKGWTDEQAAGIIGNLQQESGPNLNHQAVGDGGKAYGAAQWHPDRQANFERVFGKSIRESTLMEQMAFVDWELNNTEKAAGDRLRQAETAEQAALIVSNHYERPNARYAKNSTRVSNANSVLELAQNQEANITSPKTKGWDGIEGIDPSQLADVDMINKSATRDDPITGELQGKLQEAVYSVYGPGYEAKVYSGGQEAAGEGGKRKGSTRHDHGKAADVYVYGPDGKKVTGDELARLGQYWAAKGYGGVGMEMNGGGIHLDQHSDRFPYWFYGNESKSVKDAVKAGAGGVFPDGLHERTPVESSEPTTGDDLMKAGEEKKPIEITVPYGDLDSSVDYTKEQSRYMQDSIPVASVKKQKNTHDGINMTAIDLVGYADSAIA